MAIEQFVIAWLAFFAWALVTFTLLERLAPRKRVPIAWRRIAIAGLLLGIGAWIAERFVWVPREASSVILVVIGWVIAELLIYWIHRAMHRVPLLWRFH